MTKKRITLTMSDEDILAAKTLAKESKISVSQLFTDFVNEKYQQSLSSDSHSSTPVNDETQKAMEEARNLAHHGSGKSFSSMKELSEDLNS